MVSCEVCCSEDGLVLEKGAAGEWVLVQCPACGVCEILQEASVCPA